VVVPAIVVVGSAVVSIVVDATPVVVSTVVVVITTLTGISVEMASVTVMWVNARLDSRPRGLVPTATMSSLDRLTQKTHP